jgi:hypothetical protein
MFKLFWREDIQERPYFFNYPAGNTMADLADPEEELILRKVLLRLSRCCLKMTVEPRKPLIATKRTLEDTEMKGRRFDLDDERRPRDDGHGSGGGARKENSLSPGGQTGRQRSATVAECTEAMDGSLFHFGKYDLSHLSEKELSALSKALAKEKKRLADMDRCMEFEAELLAKDLSQCNIVTGDEKFLGM